MSSEHLDELEVLRLHDFFSVNVNSVFMIVWVIYGVLNMSFLRDV